MLRAQLQKFNEAQDLADRYVQDCKNQTARLKRVTKVSKSSCGCLLIEGVEVDCRELLVLSRYQKRCLTLGPEPNYQNPAIVSVARCWSSVDQYQLLVHGFFFILKDDKHCQIKTKTQHFLQNNDRTTAVESNSKKNYACKRQMVCSVYRYRRSTKNYGLTLMNILSCINLYLLLQISPICRLLICINSIIVYTIIISFI